MSPRPSHTSVIHRAFSVVGPAIWNGLSVTVCLMPGALEATHSIIGLPKDCSLIAGVGWGMGTSFVSRSS